MKKLILTFAAAVALITAAVPFSASAESEVKTSAVNGAVYSYTGWDSPEMTITITGVSGVSGSLTIPDSIDGYMVTAIGNKAFYGRDISSVVIPDTVTGIGDGAFKGCMELKKVTIPDSVKYIGDEAFMGCISLQEAEIGSSVKDIPNSCFYACSDLENVVLPSELESIGSEAFFSCPYAKMTIPSTVTSIGYDAIGKKPDAHSGSAENVDGYLIIGTSGSYAEKYASKYHFDFIDAENYLAGDVNGNGKVEATDASAVLAEYARASTGAMLTFTMRQQFVGDFNGSGSVNASDASAILAEYARLSTE